MKTNFVPSKKFLDSQWLIVGSNIKLSMSGSYPDQLNPNLQRLEVVLFLMAQDILMCNYVEKPRLMVLEKSK